jgi:hypothetical protein
LQSLFALTLLVSACLLFVVQPMIAKMVLPLLGGSPSVWNTCMLFFQAALLAGYAYAHATTAWLGVRRQAALHAVLLLLPFIYLPLGLTEAWSSSVPVRGNPGYWLLGFLLVTVGLPFFVVSTTAPLLQRWFSCTDHPSARDPYFLYGASNVGSMIALLSYPFVVEPNIRLVRQSELWAVGYALLVVLIVACAAVIWKTAGVPPEVSDDTGCDRPGERPGIGQWLRWVALAFIPSSLMLGVTVFITTDIAPIPLLWVIPLAIYLLTFILVFLKRPILPHRWMVRALPMIVVLLVLVMCLKTTQLFFVSVHLLALFSVGMVCHGELARQRPSARYLTAFYLAMSSGGLLGGIFNSLIAPIVFKSIVEYPLTLALACLACPSAARFAVKPKDLVLDFVIPLALGAVLAGTIWRLPPSSPSFFVLIKLVFGLSAFLCFTLKDRPIRFALGIGTVLIISQLYLDEHGRVLRQDRNYFGVLRVTEDPGGIYRKLVHGNTVHGQQCLEPGRRGEPLTYYSRTGPIGQVLESFASSPTRPSVAVVGLGTGTLAAYATPGERWTFYEIDPAVERVARDPRLFTFLEDSRARSCDVVLGDARLRLRESPGHSYGLIILDAFSSDAIPMHLLTREAMRVYLAKLAGGGLIVFHISNRYFDLAPVVGALARDAALVSRVRYDMEVTPEQFRHGKCASNWVVIAANEADLGGLAQDLRWREPNIRPEEAVWTDDFSNVTRYLLRPRLRR